MLEWFKHVEAPIVGLSYSLKNSPVDSAYPAVVTATVEGHVEYSIGKYNGLTDSYRTFNKIYEVTH